MTSISDLYVDVCVCVCESRIDGNLDGVEQFPLVSPTNVKLSTFYPWIINDKAFKR